MALRSIQSKEFDTSDSELTIRTIIATLQDLGFTVDRVDEEIGVVTGTKVGNYLMKITVSSRPHGPDRTAIRANAQFNLKAVSDPELYQKFFDALSQAIFLQANLS